MAAAALFSPGLLRRERTLTGRGLWGRSMMTRWAPRAHGLRSLLQASQPGAARALAVKAHPDRKTLLECKRVVIKVGTAVVSNPNGELVRPSACECAAVTALRLRRWTSAPGHVRASGDRIPAPRAWRRVVSSKQHARRVVRGALLPSTALQACGGSCVGVEAQSPLMV